MKKRIKDDVKEQFLDSLQTIISYPSVLNEGENGTPFGQAIQDVLEKTLELAQELGFQTYIDPEGYYGYAEIGQGEELLAVLCHLDVVPAGDLKDWQTPPFEATIVGDYIVGRGVQDDKGHPLLLFMQSRVCWMKVSSLPNGFGLSLGQMRKPCGDV